MNKVDDAGLEAALLPCPFCGWSDMDNGGLCHALRSEDNPSEVIGPSGVCCPNCSAYAVGGMDDDEAIAAWNRRAAIVAYQAKGGEVVAWQWHDFSGNWYTVDFARMTLADQETLARSCAEKHGGRARPLYAHPKPDGIGVKALQWGCDHIRGEWHGNVIENTGPGYLVGDDGRWCVRKYGSRIWVLDQIGDVDAAKAACQSDYEARIRSALTSPASGERDAPSGYVLVPLEPTEGMLAAGMDSLAESTGEPLSFIVRDVLFAYRAMVAALRMEGK